MITKAKLQEQLDNLPEEISIEELIDRLILIEKIETGMSQSENDEIISDAELNNEMEKWFK